MSQARARTLDRPTGGSIFFPTGLGFAAYFLVMAVVERSESELLLRYIAGHPVSRITTAMALIGLAALIQSAYRVWRQQQDRLEYPLPTGDEAPAADDLARASALRDQVGRTSRTSLAQYRQQRLCAAATFVEQNQSAEHLEEELKYLADVDAQRQADGYAFVRILIWAIPMLGFLGTVLGITQALGSIQVGPENDFAQMMGGLRTGLYVAFDTTAQALAFSISLMFVQFAVTRNETALLEQVDRRVRSDLSAWFEIGAVDSDAQVRAIQRMSRSILAAIEEMSQSQVGLWRRSIESAQAAWVETLQSNHSLVQQNLGDAIDASVGKLAQQMTDSLRQLDSALEHRGQQWQVHLSQLTRQIHEQQQSVLTSSQEVLKSLRTATAAPAESADTAALRQTLDALHTFLQQAKTSQEQALAMSKPSEPNVVPVRRKALRIFGEDRAA